LHCYARAIRAFFNWLVAEEYLATTPLGRLKPPKLEKRFKEVLSVAEIERLLAILNQRTFLGARMYAMIALLYDSGLRAGELVALDLADIHWNEYQTRVMGKGKKERFVPFSPPTQRALRKYLVLREPFAEQGPDALFITTDGTRLTAHAVTLAIKRLGKRAGIPRVHPHLFRHSAAVAYIMNGGDQFGLKRIFGHEQLSTTDGYMDYAQQHLAHQHKQFSPMSKVSEPRRTSGRNPAKRRDEEH
jgi:site-specific recombinase XerD